MSAAPEPNGSVDRLAQAFRDVIRETQAPIYKRLDAIDSEQVALARNVAELKTDIAELKTDIAELKTDMKAIKEAVCTLAEAQAVPFKS